MKKYYIKDLRKKLSNYKTSSFTAEEDIVWYRLDCLMNDQEENLMKESRDIIEKAKSEGVVFLENGTPDIEKSDKEALQRSNERITIISNEELMTKVLPIGILNKLKVENNISSGDYNHLLQVFLKDN